MAAKGKIVEINLPAEVTPGSSIGGTIVAENVGDATGKVGVVIHPTWGPQDVGAWALLSPGSRLAAQLSPGTYEMPDTDANLEIYAGTLEDGWDHFRRDDTRTWLVKRKIDVAGWLPWWWWIAAVGGGVGVITVVGVVAYQESKREEEVMAVLRR